MSVNKFLGLGRKVPLNFNNIKEKDEFQVLLKELNYQKTKYKKLKFVMYTLSVILITMFSTVLIQNHWPFNNQAGDVNPGKISSLVQHGYFDKTICFGPEIFKDLYKVDVILNSNIINESDKQILKEYCAKQNEIKHGHVNYFNIHFGTKEGKDIVLICDLAPVDKHMGNTFNFESNLDYTFESILLELENMASIKFTDEFLDSSKYENGKQVMGIVLNFNLNEEGINIPYYKVIVDDKVYVLNK